MTSRNVLIFLDFDGVLHPVCPRDEGRFLRPSSGCEAFREQRSRSLVVFEPPMQHPWRYRVLLPFLSRSMRQ
jgi:hypothetical protein